jgi:hypothetical protein
VPTRRGVLFGTLGVSIAQAACAAGSSLARPRPLAAPAESRLEPLGALLMDTAVLGFGGLSGLHLGPDLMLHAVSDRGFWMSARLLWRDAPVGLDELRTGPLLEADGQPGGRRARDAEALARLPDGTWLVGYEQWHRIRAHAPDLGAPARPFDAPAALSLASGNGGLESLAALPDGRLLLITEAQPFPGIRGVRRAWFGRPQSWTPLGYRPAAGMVAVDATILPEGDAVLILERGFSWVGGFTGRLVRLPVATLERTAPGSVLEAEEVLLTFAPPLPIDNYEGVAAARIDGRVVVALVSDDNEHILQQTWLLFFALPE